MKPGLGREPCMCVEWVGERVHEQKCEGRVAKSAEAGNGVRPAGLIELNVR